MLADICDTSLQKSALGPLPSLLSMMMMITFIRELMRQSSRSIIEILVITPPSIRGGRTMLDDVVARSLWPAAQRPQDRGLEASSGQRVALVTGSYDANVDGVALTLNRLVAHLMRSGHKVLVFCPRGRHIMIRSAGARVVRVPAVPLPIWWEYRLTWGLGREAREALETFAPTVVHVAVPDAMGHAAQNWAATRGVPVVCSHHTRWNRYLDYYGLRWLEPLMWWGMRRFHDGCAVTLPPSRATAAELRSHGISRVHVWPRGVDGELFLPTARSARFRRHVLLAASKGGEVEGKGEVVGKGEGEGEGEGEVRRVNGSAAFSDRSTINDRSAIGDRSAIDERSAFSEHTCVVLLVARLRWEKGLADFAATAAKLGRLTSSPFRLVVVGDGPAREGLQERLPPSALFMGPLTGDELAAAYASADVFLYPSVTEGWGATCLEAEASGLPVVATNSSGITDVVAHGLTGLLVPPGDTQALAAAVAELVSDVPRRVRMGAAARRHALNFSWAASGALVASHYQRVSAAAVSPSPGDRLSL